MCPIAYKILSGKIIGSLLVIPLQALLLLIQGTILITTAPLLNKNKDRYKMPENIPLRHLKIER